MNYGISYMGSKSEIAASIAPNFPAAENFYDLFGGGFSVSHYMLLHKRHKHKHFHYNEIKYNITDVIRRAIAGEFNYDRFKPAWISREEFHRLKSLDGYIDTCWSFGNDQRTYLFSPKIEPYKKSMHNAVVFDEFDALASEVLQIDCWPSEFTIKQKRIFLRHKIEHYRKTNIPGFLNQFLQLQRLERLQRLQQLQQLEQLERLQQLERLERLQQLQQLEQLERLTISSLDYRQVDIKPNSVVYCDIPYENTAHYSIKFDHVAFYDWATSRAFPVYVSEYNCDHPGMKLIYSVDKRSRYNAIKTSLLITQENLYWNGVSL